MRARSFRAPRAPPPPSRRRWRPRACAWGARRPRSRSSPPRSPAPCADRLDLELPLRGLRAGGLEAGLRLEAAGDPPHAAALEPVAHREGVLGVAAVAADLLPALGPGVEPLEEDVAAAVGQARDQRVLGGDLALDRDLAAADLADLQRVGGGHLVRVPA